eukprot:CAMPEP_0179162782 /NCGR_PEP_ID=MMETSP0796-20121207/79760_1 /TAXON_ID=73915 /ORGANISM="Pyrodinium bahamense, Strain pbaha01" /LENGTH=82 /DNA_ID=CAMNT_0020865009 /DNA_START=37 /DNA_END=282 /DNA_ORIENTATION=+
MPWLCGQALHDPILRLLLRHSKPLRDEQSRPTSRNFMAYDRTGVSLQVLLCISLQPPTPSVRPKRPDAEQRTSMGPPYLSKY